VLKACALDRYVVISIFVTIANELTQDFIYIFVDYSHLPGERTRIMADAPTIVAYLKPVCGWSNSVRETFSKYGLQFEDKDIINNPDIYAEMVQKSGQPLSPCVEINGQMLADVSGEEVEAWMVENGVVETVAA
jgi:glutaredoxin